MNGVGGPQLVLFHHSHGAVHNRISQRQYPDGTLDILTEPGQHVVSQVLAKLPAFDQPQDA